jgi:hypothetical protein
MQRAPLRIEPLTPIIATRDEIIAIGEAIARYTNWLARTPASAAQHQETIALLDRLRCRFAQVLTIREGE